MKLALLGADVEAVEFVRRAVDDGEHVLVSAFDLCGFERAIHEIGPRARLNEDWESLLLGSVADLVIVARGQAGISDKTGVPDDERRADQLRKLTQAGVPMLVFCPACEAIIGYEIEMIRADTKCPIFPYVPGWNWEVVEQLAMLPGEGDESPLGRIEQIVVEREMRDRGRADVLAQLARDMSVVRQVVGNITRVTASGPPLPTGRDPLGPKSAELPSLANLNVHFQGQSGLAGRWSVGPAASEQAVALTLVGSEGKAVLAQKHEDASWTLYLPGDMQQFSAVDSSQAASHVLAICEQVLAKKQNMGSSWLDACRDQEVAEAIDRSLLKGRTIELYNEEHTVGGSFKGVMAMGGCLLLVLAVGGVLLAAVVEGLQLPLRNWPLWRIWPVYLLVPFVLFLFLQLFQLAVPKTVPAAKNEKLG